MNFSHLYNLNYLKDVLTSARVNLFVKLGLPARGSFSNEKKPVSFEQTWYIFDRNKALYNIRCHNIWNFLIYDLKFFILSLFFRQLITTQTRRESINEPKKLDADKYTSIR